MIFPDGGQHLLYLNVPGFTDDGDGYYTINIFNGTECNVSSIPNPLVFYTADGTYARLELTTSAACNSSACANGTGAWVFYLPNGTRVFGPAVGAPQSSIIDRNGNTITFAYGNNATTNYPQVTISDELGRSIVLTFDPSFSPRISTQSGFVNPGPTDTITAPGFGQTLTTTVNWQIPTISSYELTYYCPGQTPPNCQTTPGNSEVNNIQLPSTTGALEYIFTYNDDDNPSDKGWGELKTMTMPYGAQVQYAYRRGGPSDLNLSVQYSYSATDDPIVGKTLTYTDSTGTQRTQSWCYTAWGYDINTQPGVDNCSGTNQTLGYTAKLVRNPDGGIRKYLRNTPPGYNPPGGIYYGNTIPQIIEETQPDGDVIDRTWRENCPGANTISGGTITYGAPINPYIKAEFHTVLSTQGNKISTQFFGYDRNGNPSNKQEYDFASFTLSNPEASGSYPPSFPTNVSPTLIRSTTNTYWTGVGISTDPTICTSIADDAEGYWHTLESSPAAAAKLDAPKTSEISDPGGVETRTEYSYDNPLATGNLMAETSWDSTMGSYSAPLTSGNSIVTRYSYDVSGNQISTTDPNGILSSSTFDQCPASVGGTSRYAYPSSQTAAGLAEHFTWDCQSGLRLTSTDPNGVSSHYGYDNLGRQTLIQEAFGINGVERDTSISYSEATTSTSTTIPLTVTTHKDLFATRDGIYTIAQQFDQLGQIAAAVKGDTTTQHLGSLISGSITYEATANPQFTAGNDATAGWTRTMRDVMGRVTEVDYYSGTVAPSPWANNSVLLASAITTYDGYSTTIADESGNARQQIVDGAGRLMSVTEDPGSSPHLNYVTSYQYDFHDNLKSVNQSGLTRSFGYSSLARLISATNPENGTIGYTYDENGNLLTRTDARGIVTTYAFDNLNRLRSKSYSDGTATSTSCYGDDPNTTTITRGGGSNAKSVSWSCSGAPTGSYLLQRLTLESGDQSKTLFTQYDALGNVLASQQITNGSSYSFPKYSYLIYGSPKSMQLPSGRVLTWMYDNSARPNGVSGTSTPYASVPASNGFWPNGAIQTLNLAGGTTFSQSSIYDARLRPTTLKVSTSSPIETLGYSWSANGNLQQETVANTQNTVSTFAQNFNYDSLNRLISVCESGGTSEWLQEFGYDPYGNRSLLTASSYPCSGSAYIPYAGVTPQASAPAILGQTVAGPFTNNRINGSNNDAAGNATTGATLTTTSTAAYDAENRLLTITDATMSSTPYFRYYYDGEGRRMMKVLCSTSPCADTTVGAQITTFVYDALGELVAEYGPPGPIAGTQYIFADHLGSTRMTLSSTGVPSRCYDYAPFGEELTPGVGPRANCYSDVIYPSANPEALSTKFTSKERDAETGLDWFDTRYFSGAQGRFTSPDQPFDDQESSDPQSWNLYSYVRNNPLKFVDPSGRDCVYLNESSTAIGSIDNQTNAGHCGNNGGYWVNGTVTGAQIGPNLVSLTGTTNGTDVTTASYAVAPDPSLMALREAGNRASRDLSTSVILMGGTAAAITVVSVAPLAYAALPVGSEAGILSLGKGFQLARNAQGKIKGDIKDIWAAVLKMSPEQLKQAADELRQSIQIRAQELLQKGDEPAHRLRVSQERDILRTIEKKLGSN